jgi:hypothetical protein
MTPYDAPPLISHACELEPEDRVPNPIGDTMEEGAPKAGRQRRFLSSDDLMAGVGQGVEHPTLIRHGRVRAQIKMDLKRKDLQIDL